MPESNSKNDELSRELLRIGAEEAQSGLTAGIVLSCVFAVIGCLFFFTGIRIAAEPAPGDPNALVLILPGLAAIVLCLYIAFRHVRLRSKIKDVL
ncbi:MAG: hypothetical protein AAF720_12650 [Pseudomonadota bacterium]